MSADGDRVCYLDGAYLPLAEARVPVLDRGFIFGDAVYEVIPVHRGVPFALDEHLRRLARNLAEVAIEDPLSPAAWCAMIARLVRDNGGGELTVYVQVTRGVAERDHAFPRGLTPTVFAMTRALRPRRGLGRVSAITLDDCRWARCDIKTTSLLANVLLRQRAVAAGAHEALLIRDGCVTEGAASNVFVVADGAAATPPLSGALLPGVTRALLIEAARGAGIAVRESAVSVAALRAADEIWITSSSSDLLCVAALDGAPVGDGASYPLAERAARAFAALKTARCSLAQTDPTP